jgi:hypothetical protein
LTLRSRLTRIDSSEAPLLLRVEACIERLGGIGERLLIDGVLMTSFFREM